MDTKTLEIVVFLALVGNSLVGALFTPLFEKFKWDKFPITYITWVITSLLVFWSGANLFLTFFPSALVGKILTAVLAGGGAKFLRDLFAQLPPKAP